MAACCASCAATTSICTRRRTASSLFEVISTFSTLFRCHFGSDHIDLHAAADRRLTVVAAALSILQTLRRAIFGEVLIFWKFFNTFSCFLRSDHIDLSASETYSNADRHIVQGRSHRHNCHLYAAAATTSTCTPQRTANSSPSCCLSPENLTQTSSSSKFRKLTFVSVAAAATTSTCTPQRIVHSSPSSSTLQDKPNDSSRNTSFLSRAATTSTCTPPRTATSPSSCCPARVRRASPKTKSCARSSSCATSSRVIAQLYSLDPNLCHISNI